MGSKLTSLIRMYHFRVFKLGCSIIFLENSSVKMLLRANALHLGD